jgi:hypothetical protein
MENQNNSIAISFVKYLEMRDFAEKLALTNSKVVDHKGGFFVDKFVYKASPAKDGSVLADAFAFYSPGDFKRYITIDSYGKHSLREEISSPNTCDFVSKVIKFEDYELSTVDKRILEAIKANEEVRKNKQGQGI